MHLAGAVTLWLVLLHNLSPQQAGSTELGYLHEVVLRDTHVELDTLSGFRSIDTGLGEDVQVLSTPGQSVAQLLIDVAAGIVQRHAVDVDALVAGQLLQGLNKRLTLSEYGRHVLTLLQDFLNGVEVDASLQLGQRVILLLEVSH